MTLSKTITNYEIKTSIANLRADCETSKIKHKIFEPIYYYTVNMYINLVNCNKYFSFSCKKLSVLGDRYRGEFTIR